MVVRIAAAMSLVAFATCLAMGIVAENSFGTIILRALGAMIATLVVGLIVGAMGQKMLEENLSAGQKNSPISERKPGAEDR
jgi:NhaP-type Na+/H+ or K+/H+ antiporter